MMLELWKDGKKFSGYDKNLVRTPSIQTRGGLFWGSESEKATPKGRFYTQKSKRPNPLWYNGLRKVAYRNSFDCNGL